MVHANLLRYSFPGLECRKKGVLPKRRKDFAIVRPFALGVGRRKDEDI